MAIDIATEKLIGFGESGKLPGKPSYQSLRRWADEGKLSPVTSRKVRLENVYIGGIRHTSQEAYVRFIAELNRKSE